MIAESIERLMTPAQVARELGVSVERVRQLERRGQLRAHRSPLGRLFDPVVVEALWREREEVRHAGQSAG